MAPLRRGAPSSVTPNGAALTPRRFCRNVLIEESDVEPLAMADRCEHSHHMPRKSRIVDTATIRRLAVEADADPRSVERRLSGRPIVGMPGQRIDRVLAAHGIRPAVKPTDRTVA